MKSFIILILLINSFVGCTQSVDKKDRAAQDTAQSIKSEITELLQCKCIDAHIDAIADRYSTVQEKLPSSPLLMGKLVYNGFFSQLDHQKLLALSDTFYYSAVDFSIKEYKQKREGVTSMTNIFNWCKLKSIDYVNLNWGDIQNKYLVKVSTNIEN